MRHKTTSKLIILVLVIALCAVLAGISWVVYRLPQQVESVFGPASPSLTVVQKYSYAFQLEFHKDELLSPAGRGEKEIKFSIESGEGIQSIANRLYQEGFISNTESFIDYLIYSGLDTKIQARTHTINNLMNPVAIAYEIVDATPEEVTFGLLAGWRIEEIAGTIPNSGLAFGKEEFLNAAQNPATLLDLSFWGDPTSLEGLLPPGEFIIQRTATLGEFLSILEKDQEAQFSDSIISQLASLGLSPYEGLILASIVEREAMVDEEKPMIASVFYNRLESGMRLDSDPTVQYAIGFNSEQNTWWTNPINAEQLQIDSLNNTYLYQGLPPSPISAPSVKAIEAVASPAQTPYYYFRAACDGSGKHQFAVTYEEHLQNACP
ncbi:MAG: endolytic transglycosylase MltG [Anaerolineaceae bacterium]